MLKKEIKRHAKKRMAPCDAKKGCCALKHNTTPKQTNNIFITDSAERETINSNLTTISTTTITNTTTTTTTLSFVEGKEGFYCISSPNPVAKNKISWDNGRSW